MIRILIPIRLLHVSFASSLKKPVSIVSEKSPAPIHLLPFACISLTPIMITSPFSLYRKSPNQIRNNLNQNSYACQESRLSVGKVNELLTNSYQNYMRVFYILSLRLFFLFPFFLAFSFFSDICLPFYPVYPCLVL